MKKIKVINIFTCLGISLSILVACNEGISATIASPLPITATISSINAKSIAMPSQTSSIAQTPTFTLDAAYQTWRATAIAIQSTQNAASQQSRDEESTKIAQFPVACEDYASHASISPNGEWLATSCGYKRDQTLVVQNKEETKWILEFKDFLHPDSIQDGEAPMGCLYPKFWSPDGAYLYFTTTLGYDGGGNDCFPYFKGAYGLFRLSLKTGSWATLISPTDSFPGYGIRFSPTGRRYAVDINGVTISDLNTGDVININVSDTVEGLSWSPDGIHLAYSIASCGEQYVQSSSVYVWDASTNQTQVLFATTDGILLEPEIWNNNSIFRISGKKLDESTLRYVYTIYVYDIAQNSLVFSGTATPSP